MITNKKPPRNFVTIISMEVLYRKFQVAYPHELFLTLLIDYGWFLQIQANETIKQIENQCFS